MSDSLFKNLSLAVAAGFTIFFAVTIIPPLLANPDIVGAFAAGFVNPYSSGYATDVILCWVLLLIWVIYEAKKYSVKRGWICLLLGIVPGVAVGMALYLVMRHDQINHG
ncbi:MAG: DUF2834 domain-containing protein [Pseudomonadota bacterium]